MDSAIADPLPMIASDGEILPDGHGHPRSAGTHARVLGQLVRERQVLPLMLALKKMTLMPAELLASRVPAMRNKGRVRVGADADVTLFDPDRVIDRATFREPTAAPIGIDVLVLGEPVVHNGRIEDGVLPGRPIRPS